MSFSPELNTYRPAPLLQAASRFDALFDVYGLSLKHLADAEQQTLTLIAQSPLSPAAQALAVNLARFQPKSLRVQIVLAQIAPSNALNFLVEALREACTDGPEVLIRWAKDKALLEAHERLLLGRALCWTGDAMRRSSDARCAIDRIEDCTDSVFQEVSASFSAIWRASKPLPKELFFRLMRATASQQADEDPAAHCAIIDANIIRLDEYLRSRRH